MLHCWVMVELELENSLSDTQANILDLTHSKTFAKHAFKMKIRRDTQRSSVPSAYWIWDSVGTPSTSGPFWRVGISANSRDANGHLYTNI